MTTPIPEELVELAETLKRTVRLARAYATGTGSIFEGAMTKADSLADRVLEKSRASQENSRG